MDVPSAEGRSHEVFMLAGRDAVPAGVADTAASSGGSWGAGSGALRTPVGPGPVKGQLPGYRDGAPRGAAHLAQMRRGPAIRVRPSIRAVRRNPDNAPSRRAIALTLRGAKGDGHPAPDAKPGAGEACACCSGRR